MGMNVGGSKKGPKSDINVTPLVDIVLVLLIIFLVVTPIKLRHLTIEVPRKLQDNEDTSQASRQITVTMRANNTIQLSDGSDDVEVPSVFELAAKLRPMIEKKTGEKVVFVDFDDKVRYGDTVITMDTIKGAGAEKIALKIREEEKSDSQ